MNEILEEFKIVFGFDDKPLQEGIKKTENSLNGLGKLFGAITASFISFQGLKALTIEYADFNVKLNESTSLLGLNTAEVSALGGALERFGGNTDSAISSLKSLNSSLEESKRGQGSLVEVSRKYGLSFSPYASATNTLKSLSKQMGKFSDQQRVVIAQQLGLDDSLVRAFKDGGVELEKQIERQKKWGTATEEDIKISKAFNNAQLDLKDIFGALTRDFARVILPSFTKLVELFSSFIEWVRQHKQLVIIFFAGLLLALSPILIILGKMAIASVLAFAPFYAVLAVLAVISLVVEDIYGYFMGWDSVTGDLLSTFSSDWAKVVEEWSNGWEIFKKDINDVIEKGKSIFDSFKAIGEGIINFLSKPFDEFAKKFDSWTNNIKNIGSTIKDWFGFGDIEANQNMTVIPQAPTVPYQNSVVNKQQSNQYNVNNNFNQNISTATPKQFADNTNSQIVSSITDIRQQNGAL